jgi:hypothetical protein
MSATTARDQVCSLAKTDPEGAFLQALSVTEPWFACQALAFVLRYGPPSIVARASAAFSSRADTCPDDYQRGAVRAWQVRALAERGLVSQAQVALARAVDFARLAEPPASRSEALFLLFQAGHPLGASSIAPLAAMLAEVWRAQPQRWRCSRALVEALAMLSVVAVTESEHILRSVADERISGRVERTIASGATTPRPFFW